MWRQPKHITSGTFLMHTTTIFILEDWLLKNVMRRLHVRIFRLGLNLFIWSEFFPLFVNYRIKIVKARQVEYRQIAYM